MTPKYLTPTHQYCNETRSRQCSTLAALKTLRKSDDEIRRIFDDAWQRKHLSAHTELPEQPSVMPGDWRTRNICQSERSRRTRADFTGRRTRADFNKREKL